MGLRWRLRRIKASAARGGVLSELEHNPTVWNHVTVVPAKAGTQGERRAVALDPRLRGGDDRVCSTCSETALGHAQNQVRTVLVASAIRATAAPSDALARYGPLTAVATPPWRTPKRTKEANESGDDHEYPDNRHPCLLYRPPSLTVNRLNLLGPAPHKSHLAPPPPTPPH